MKKLLLISAFCLFCVSLSSAQATSAISAQAQPLRFQENTLHASQHEMARPTDVLEHSEFTSEHGERPVWEFGADSLPVTPLGDIARANRKQHALVKRADIIWEN